MDAAGRRWTHTDELLRHLCTLLDALVRAYMTVHADPNLPPRLGQPFTYRRPGETATSSVPVVRPRDLARRMAAGR